MVRVIIFFLYALFGFPALLLHEGSHLIMTLLLIQKVKSVRIYLDLNTDKLSQIGGSVESGSFFYEDPTLWQRTRTILIVLAPLVSYITIIIYTIYNMEILIGTTMWYISLYVCFYSMILLPSKEDWNTVKICMSKKATTEFVAKHLRQQEVKETLIIIDEDI